MNSKIMPKNIGGMVRKLSVVGYGSCWWMNQRSTDQNCMDIFSCVSESLMHLMSKYVCSTTK